MARTKLKSGGTGPYAAIACPKCGVPKTLCTDCRENRRRRRCPSCGFKFTTWELVAGHPAEAKVPSGGEANRRAGIIRRALAVLGELEGEDY